MAWVVTAVVAAFEVTTVATVLTAISAVGMATTVVGAVTGNKNLMKIGGEISMVGGIGSLVNAGIGALGAAGAAGADVAAGQIATDMASQTAGDAVADAASDAVSNVATDGLVADSVPGLAGTVSDASAMAGGTPAWTSAGTGSDGGFGLSSDVAGSDWIGSQQNNMGMSTDVTGAVNPPNNFIQPVSQTVPMQGTVNSSLDVGGNVVGSDIPPQPGLQFNTNGSVNTTTGNKFAETANFNERRFDTASGIGDSNPNGSGAAQIVPDSPVATSTENQSFLDKLGSKWDSLTDAQKLEFTKTGLALPFNILNQRNQQAALELQRQKQAQTSYGSAVPRFGIINSVRRN